MPPKVVGHDQELLQRHREKAKERQITLRKRKANAIDEKIHEIERLKTQLVIENKKYTTLHNKSKRAVPSGSIEQWWSTQIEGRSIGESVTLNTRTTVAELLQKAALHMTANQHTSTAVNPDKSGMTLQDQLHKSTKLAIQYAKTQLHEKGTIPPGITMTAEGTWKIAFSKQIHGMSYFDYALEPMYKAMRGILPAAKEAGYIEPDTDYTIHKLSIQYTDENIKTSDGCKHVSQPDGDTEIRVNIGTTSQNLWHTAARTTLPPYGYDLCSRAPFHVTELLGLPVNFKWTHERSLIVARDLNDYYQLLCTPEYVKVKFNRLETLILPGRIARFETGSLVGEASILISAVAAPQTRVENSRMFQSHNKMTLFHMWATKAMESGDKGTFTRIS
jgi:hypothetical protein